MNLRLKVDSRDFIHSQAFSQAVDIPEEINFDTPLPDDIQPLGDIKCVAYSVCDEAEDEFGKEFDILDLWSRVPHTQLGSDPREVLNEVIKNGLLPKGQKDRMKDYKSFYRADMGQRDPFDNVRISATIAQTSVIGAIYWCAEWLNVPAFGVMPDGKTQLNGHAFTIEGWKIVNGEPMFIVEFWGGRKCYMPRSVFNKAMSSYGTQTWILATEEINNKRQKTVLEAIRDACLNVIILLKQLLAKNPPVEKPVEPKPQEVYNEVKESLKPNMIEKWAKAIDRWEGNTFGNNPGNLKYSTLIASFGAKRGKAGSDGGYFAVFDTYEQGFKALCSFLELGCKNQLKSYKNARTLGSFMKIYAGNPPAGYINGIAKDLGVSLDVNISTFL
jgi:hypothetical protein